MKRQATETAFEALAGVTVTPEAVDSGVSDQPVGHDETLRGAETRAERALAAGSYDLGVGIEGGVASFGGDQSGRRAWGEGDAALYLIMWAAVTDGETTGRGAGPSLRLPDDVADRIRAGGELGPVLDDAFDLENVKESQGAAGVLTGNIIDRRTALRTAVAGALGPFVTDAYR